MPAPGACMNILEARQKQEGYGSITNPERFLNQNYNDLKQYCLIKGVRYIDDMFPPDARSIGQGLLSPSDLKRVEWLRPRFWRFGRWVDVVIDDKLPTINGKLIFVHSKDPNEFWPALLEKAYAKVCGSYTDMTAGTPAEALMDFTGGVHMCIQLGNPPQNLWELMCRAGQSKSLMGCGTHEGKTSENTVLPNGLVQGHAYTVTGVKQMKSQGKFINLVRLWNPWGKGEWNGDWSDGSSLWKTVSAEDREMCLSVADDGEFWMTLEDFCKFYSDLDICCLCPSFLDGSSSCQWKSSFYEGRWVAGTTAGGCMNNRDSFWTNPQYRVKIGGEYSGAKNMLLSLMQKPDKRNRRLVQNLHIGFSVFEYKEQTGKFPASFFTSHAPVGQTKTYMNAREVMEFLSLKPGEYLIVPSTFHANETASFILTILSKAETHAYENSGGHRHNHEPIEKETNGNAQEDVKKKNFFRQHSDKYDEVDAEQLRVLLNNEILKGDLKSGGFSLDACRSMVALMDDTFFRTDVSRTGTLSLSELRNAFIASGAMVSDDMLNLMALRYASSGQVTLESFISLILRLDCMYKIFKQLSDGKTMSLHESEYEGQRGKFPASFFTSHAPVAQTKTYINAREVMEFMTVKPGEYLIVPSTFSPNETASFILTILSKSETHIHETSGGGHEHMEGEQDIFFSSDISQTGTLSLKELRNAIMASGRKRVSDEMLNLMALRYGSSSGVITLESFINLMLRFDCMNRK
ncbi:Calpain-9 [Nibea albiflora]|uniref:Calpain-9 n=1 Tax=Nibea albiflora TaxID=240163 RepID=A0ACB7FHN0_NIBAL|nr:Calpain-9 [Nibea albiflora]